MPDSLPEKRDPAITQAERWLDYQAAPPGSTVWIVWQSNGYGIDIKAIVSRYSDVEEWRRQQMHPIEFCCSEWRVLGAGWPAGQPNQSKE